LAAFLLLQKGWQTPTTQSNSKVIPNKHQKIRLIMWTEIDNKLHRKFTFTNFIIAMEFMQESALVMEKMNHHAEWKNIYNKVEIWLSTHDAGDVVTEKDHTLSKELDKIAIKFIA